jgi:hypothetical protein
MKWFWLIVAFCIYMAFLTAVAWRIVQPVLTRGASKNSKKFLKNGL